MEFKGTKGKWESHGYFIHSPDGIVAKAVNQSTFDRKENAKLMAASPDLLEACQLMLLDMEERGRNMQGDAVEIMKSAINKALGNY